MPRIIDENDPILKAISASDPSKGGRGKKRYNLTRIRINKSVEQDIAPVPQVKNWQRRLACKNNLELFLQTYLSALFYLPFSQDHQEVLRKGEISVLEEGLFACSMPRGSGKTQIAIGTATWAILYGHKRFLLLIGATASASAELMEGIKYVMESVDYFPLLLEDFPEAIYPIDCLEGESRRCRTQRCSLGDEPDAEVESPRTGINWSTNNLVMAKVPDGNWIDGKTIGPPPCGNALVKVSSVTGRLRGFNVKGIRPDLVIVDDPQTDESARSPAGRDKTERTLATVAIGLAGPGKKISGIMPCTVIDKDDAIDRVLNHDLHPEWNSVRTKMLKRFPEEMSLWDKYRDILYSYDSKILGDKEAKIKQATSFYQEHHHSMNKGAEVSWPARYDRKIEVDALQHSMNLYYQDPTAFFAEYQNEPRVLTESETIEVTSDSIVSRLSNLEKGYVPGQATTLTMGVDVQQHCLYWVVAAWKDDDYTGWIVDYGTWPDQKSGYFRYLDVRHTIEAKLGVMDESSTTMALRSLANELIAHSWPYGSSRAIQISKCLVDAGFRGQAVQAFCQETRWRDVCFPSYGKGLGAKVASIDQWKPMVGEIKRPGANWVNRIGRLGRYVIFDSNYWKSFLHGRMITPPSSPGSLSLFGEVSNRHKMYADHLTSERPVRVSGMRTVDEWLLKPNSDNHWLDATVLALVAASVSGVSLPGVHIEATKTKKKVKFSEQQRQRIHRLDR